jgi:phenylpropionate dioxygenase-like ring-hydroxylating dioxygenase large terminal subunit
VTDGSASDGATSPEPPGHHSVVRLARAWFPVCTSSELKGRPIGRAVQGVPLVLFRAEGGAPAALLDRCPHRNVPLSLGRQAGGELECAYHGWRFDGRGACRAVPGLCGPSDGPARRATAFATLEQDGLIWVASSPGEAPPEPPARIPLLEAPGYTTVRFDQRLRGTLHAAVENALDVPHTAFLHGGLFRTARQVNEIEVEVRRAADRVEAEYLGEPRPKGLLGRLLAPTGGAVSHVDRFILPCLAQVEYRLGPRSHLVATTAFTPVGDHETHLFSSVSLRLPVPAGLVRPLLLPLALRVLSQDARVLSAQADAIARFGGERFVHTEIDVLGPHVWHLLRQAERGLAAEPLPPYRRRLRT